MNSSPRSKFTPVLRCGRRQWEIPALDAAKRLLEQQQALEQFSAKHPWWPELHPQDRQLVRMLIGRLEQRGLYQEASCFWEALDLIGGLFGKDPLPPMITHLYQGGGFECQGVQIQSPDVDPQRPQTEPLVPFVLRYLSPEAAAGNGPFIAQLLFDAFRVKNEKVKMELNKSEDSVQISESVLGRVL